MSTLKQLETQNNFLFHIPTKVHNYKLKLWRATGYMSIPQNWYYLSPCDLVKCEQNLFLKAFYIIWNVSFQ